MWQFMVKTWHGKYLDEIVSNNGVSMAKTDEQYYVSYVKGKLSCVLCASCNSYGCKIWTVDTKGSNKQKLYRPHRESKT